MTGLVKMLATVTAVLLVVHCSDDGASSDDGGSPDATSADGGVAPANINEIIDGCIRASACGILTYPTLTNCLAAYHDLHRSQGLGPIYDKLYRCVNAARGDCAAVATCFGQGPACSGSYVAQCKGKVAVYCDLIDKRVYELDCGVAGLECGIKSGQASVANCTPGKCDSSFKDTCKGLLELSCSSGLLEMRDCSEQGMTCGIGGGKYSTTGCKGETGIKCSTWGKDKFSPSCKTSTAITCVGRVEHHDDCTSHKQMATACSGASCVPGGTECSGDFNRCAGAKLETCLDGVWKQHDCAALGLGACAKSATYGANCTKK